MMLLYKINFVPETVKYFFTWRDYFLRGKKQYQVWCCFSWQYLIAFNETLKKHTNLAVARWLRLDSISMPASKWLNFMLLFITTPENCKVIIPKRYFHILTLHVCAAVQCIFRLVSSLEQGAFLVGFNGKYIEKFIEWNYKNWRYRELFDVFFPQKQEQYFVIMLAK